MSDNACPSLVECPGHTPVRLCLPSAGLNSEQLALLDFLILARAHKFVGFGPSTFSTYLKEHRTLHSRPTSLRCAKPQGEGSHNHIAMLYAFGSRLSSQNTLVSPALLVSLPTHILQHSDQRTADRHRRSVCSIGTHNTIAAAGHQHRQPCKWAAGQAVRGCSCNLSQLSQTSKLYTPHMTKRHCTVNRQQRAKEASVWGRSCSTTSESQVESGRGLKEDATK